MRLYTFLLDDESCIGFEHEEKIIAINAASVAYLAEKKGVGAPAIDFPIRDMHSLIRYGEQGLDWIRSLREFVDSADNYLTQCFRSVVLDEAKVLAPISRPGKILGSGINYHGHFAENPKAVMPKEPNFFSKLPSAVIGSNEPIVIPDCSDQVDYEVEFAVVIGSYMKDTPVDEVMNGVYGYTLLHDVSARDVQFKDNGITLGKNCDTFAPMGPCIVTKDELSDLSDIKLRTTLNGQVMQDSSTSDWVFPLEAFIQYVTTHMTLEPGDIVTTGTPAGTGYFRDPQVFLKSGDTVTIEADDIGQLTNPVQ